MTDKRPPFPGSAPPPPPGGAPGRREPPQVLRRDPNYQPSRPQHPQHFPATPHPRHPPPPPRRAAPPPPQPPRRAPPPPPVAGPPARKPRRRRRYGRILLVVVLAFAASAVGLAAWVDSSLTRITVLSNYPDRPAQGAGTTWLIVGSDGRAGLTPEQEADLSTGGDLEFAGSARTDTIMIVHIPGIGSGTPATMVSIPRDSYLPIPGYGDDKVNAAFTIGGPTLLVQTVEQAAGLRIDHYVEIGFSGFADLVNAVGGVTMCPTEPISDPLAGIELPAGCQKFNGRNALGFVRTRATPRADLDRMTHQREFMSALMHRSVSPEVLLNPLRWYPMARAAVDTVIVDKGSHAWDLARLAWTLRGDIATVTVPIGEFTDSGAGSVVVWDGDAAQRLFSALNSDSPIPQDVLDAGGP